MASSTIEIFYRQLFLFDVALHQLSEGMIDLRSNEDVLLQVRACAGRMYGAAAVKGEFNSVLICQHVHSS